MKDEYFSFSFIGRGPRGPPWPRPPHCGSAGAVFAPLPSSFNSQRCAKLVRICRIWWSTWIRRGLRSYWLSAYSVKTLVRLFAIIHHRQTSCCRAVVTRCFVRWPDGLLSTWQPGARWRHAVWVALRSQYRTIAGDASVVPDTVGVGHRRSATDSKY